MKLSSAPATWSMTVAPTRMEWDEKAQPRFSVRLRWLRYRLLLWHGLEHGADGLRMEPVWFLGSAVCFVARERHSGHEAEAQSAEFDVFGGTSGACFGVFVVGGIVDLLPIVAIFLEAARDSEATELFAWCVG
jgi:hypothetical protein